PLLANVPIPTLGHPGERPIRGSIRRGPIRVKLLVRDDVPVLVGLGLGLGRAQAMVWRRDEGDEFCDELLRGHVDGAGFARKLQSNAARWQPWDGRGGEGGSQEIAAARNAGPDDSTLPG